MNLKASLLGLLIGLSPLCAIASEPMSAGEFERYVDGKTLYFGLAGSAYGAEEYLPDRQVRWSFLDGHCKEGFWYEEAGAICFVYEDVAEPQCWSFFQEGDKLRAVFNNDPASTVLYEAQQDQEPMMCLGPDVGV